MKACSLLFCILMAGSLLATDTAGWLYRAREAIADGSPMLADENDEDGLYCLIMEKVVSSDDEPTETDLAEAELKAKRRLTAYIHGESISAERTLEKTSTESKDGDGKKRMSSSTFTQKMKTSVDALMRGAKVLGHVVVDDTMYIVLLASEVSMEQAELLKETLGEASDEGAVTSAGEAETRDLALQKALRGAVEQVLGTVVVGYDKKATDQNFERVLVSGMDGFVERYRILSEEEVDVGTRVEVAAYVSKNKLLESYRNYMRFLGDPAFYMETDSDELRPYFTQLFIDLGIRMTETKAEAAYVIKCDGKFNPVTHPQNRRKGTQLSLTFKVTEIGSTETLLNVSNNPRKSTTFVSPNSDRQREICAEKAFKQMKDPLHEKIQGMIAGLASKKMEQVTPKP